jgi:YD repeat-containing protein
MNKKIKSFSTIVILLCLIFSLPAFAETVKYEYNGLHRLTRVERDKTITIYEYDDLGNRTSMVVTLKHETPITPAHSAPTNLRVIYQD